jgi:hypothetical protein
MHEQHKAQVKKIQAHLNKGFKQKVQSRLEEFKNEVSLMKASRDQIFIEKSQL